LAGTSAEEKVDDASAVSVRFWNKIPVAFDGNSVEVTVGDDSAVSVKFWKRIPVDTLAGTSVELKVERDAEVVVPADEPVDVALENEVDESLVVLSSASDVRIFDRISSPSVDEAPVLDSSLDAMLLLYGTVLVALCQRVLVALVTETAVLVTKRVVLGVVAVTVTRDTFRQEHAEE